MQYGHFDDRAREYVITRPDTPAPWVNYLGSPEYGAIISNNAGGYSFARSGANGRILRYVFNQFDQPGRYLYLRDDDSGDFWSASWQPVGKDLAAAAATAWATPACWPLPGALADRHSLHRHGGLRRGHPGAAP